MSLRSLAESDLSFILEDDINGFGWAIILTNPDGLSANLKGMSSDISQLIDPDTGQAISGRLASIALRISSLIAAGLSLPENISESNKKPWIVSFKDINGNDYTFKVMQSNPDRAIGLVTCILESYTP